MNLTDVLVWVFRGFGAFYFVFGILAARQHWFWARLSPDVRRLAQVLDEFSTEVGQCNEPAKELAREDVARPWWLFASAVLAVLAGVAMMFTHRLALALLAAGIAQMMGYFVRQRLRELKAATPGEAAEARLDQRSANPFFLLLVMTVLGGWLYYQGALV